jgi:signal transduction histidine kinase
MTSTHRTWSDRPVGLADCSILITLMLQISPGEIDTEVKSSLGDIRRLVEALRPPALDKLGLLGAVRSRAAALGGDLRIDVSGSEPSDALPAAIETAPYRIAVEAMINAVRHSGGTHCAISILVDDSAVEVLARDWGIPRIGVGRRGHINSSSGIGSWDLGRALLIAFTAGLRVPSMESRRRSR